MCLLNNLLDSQRVRQCATLKAFVLKDFDDDNMLLEDVL